MKHEAAATILFGLTALFGLITAFAGLMVAVLGGFRVGATLCGIAIASWVVAWLTIRWMQ